MPKGKIKKRGKKRKKEKAPKKGEKVIVLEYLVDVGFRKTVRLNDNKEEWLTDNAQLQEEVDTLLQELEATIALLRHQETDDKRRCEDTLSEQSELLAQQERELNKEYAEQAAEIHALTDELTAMTEEASEVTEQVHYWRNYPHVQSREKKAVMKGLRDQLRHVDKLYTDFEEQLDGNFRYMQRHLLSNQTVRLEKAKQAAARWRLGLLRLSDHSDLSAQDALCLQSVLLSGEGGDLRQRLDRVDADNEQLQRKLVPMRLPERYADGGAVEYDNAQWKLVRERRHLHLDELTDLLSARQPTADQSALVAEVRDTTIAALHPDDEQLRARKQAARAAAATAARQSRQPARSAARRRDDVAAESACSQLLPFESPLRPTARSLAAAQTLQPFEKFSQQGRHWWRVHVAQLKRRTWPVSELLLAEYAERPAVYDLEAGPKVLFEEASESSTHVSDEWRSAKLAREQHLARRSQLSLTPPESQHTSQMASDEQQEEEQSLTSILSTDVSSIRSRTLKNVHSLTSAGSVKSEGSKKSAVRSAKAVRTGQSVTASANEGVNDTAETHDFCQHSCSIFKI